MTFPDSIKTTARYDKRIAIVTLDNIRKKSPEIHWVILRELSLVLSKDTRKGVMLIMLRDLVVDRYSELVIGKN